ncbi:GNAT family N-acetyltransferase [Isoptericola sp. NEAU-Y5]|uniref:GNAT family N-acetyltransferase n=1 Tax=Isoptericola luteus TaxID=2879484 RepID=A0ABS7ZAK2_9MICO|nr:GNAT family N-acetyltransferase [Isoptericola sp. NEAU-Y5]MCA5892050.1 GNAT family N-acetyltransferase [Isoptericola sp. NEAU-Y5]
MDWKIELIFVPVTDVDRSKEFYERIGFHADHDRRVDDGLRFVQMTPPGSACSIAFGTGLGSGLTPGQQDTIQVVVPDADEALAGLRGADVDAQGVEDLPWGRFVTFDDPDGNTWTLQQLPAWSGAGS